MPLPSCVLENNPSCSEGVTHAHVRFVRRLSCSSSSTRQSDAHVQDLQHQQHVARATTTSWQAISKLTSSTTAIATVSPMSRRPVHPRQCTQRSAQLMAAGIART